MKTVVAGAVGAHCGNANLSHCGRFPIRAPSECVGGRTLFLWCQCCASSDVPCDLSLTSTQTSFCDYLWSTFGGDIPWVQNRYPSTPSSITGPFGGPGGRPYLFVESSHHNNSDPTGKTAILYSVEGAWTGLHFKYHMFGDHIGSLAVYTRTHPAAAWQEVWRREGEQQVATTDPWIQEHLKFAQQMWRVRIIAETDGQIGDKAIADLVLTRVPGNPLGPPGDSVPAP